uniref:Death domain-containing protein n=1 Tax=Ornithorhynchus anatinus TaxID=9258 RepID=A0A6I8N3S1_ORNAN
ADGLEGRGEGGSRDHPPAASSSAFPPPPPGEAGGIIPVYCSLLAAVVVGLLAYVAFKCRTPCGRKRAPVKARAAELGTPEAEKPHGDGGVFPDAPGPPDAHLPAEGPRPEPPRFYAQLPAAQREEVSRLPEGPAAPAGGGWRGLAGRLGYEEEAVDTFGRGRAPAHTLLSDWTARAGGGATLEALEAALAALGRHDAARALGPPGEGSSLV